ncbi:MAG: glycosyltransferase family 2 protein [Clostridiales bacterium]|nr:glycosyltransferase family 2 protein [Clostridiales bacterium]
MSKSVSGCIVTFNNIKTIDSALSSVITNTKLPLKLFVVDNGSTDGTAEFIEKNYPDVTLIRSEKNIGFGAGHNTVLPFLDSDYHAIINPDIVIKDDIMSVMAEYLDKDDTVGLLSPEIRFPDGRMQILGKKKPYPHYLAASRLRSGNNINNILRSYAMLNRDLTVPFDIQNATGCFMFIRTSLFKQIGGFDERYFLYFEDCDLTREVNRLSRCLYFPGAVVYHEWGRESKKNTRLALIQMQSMFKYYLKWTFKKDKIKK